MRSMYAEEPSAYSTGTPPISGCYKTGLENRLDRSQLVKALYPLKRLPRRNMDGRVVWHAEDAMICVEVLV